MALSSSSSGSSSEGMSSTCCSSSTSPVDELISSGSLSSWPFLGSFLLLTCPDGWEDFQHFPGRLTHDLSDGRLD